MRRRKRCVLGTLIFGSLAGVFPRSAAAQVTRFLAAGAGASLPTGSASRGMNTGWLAEVMGGVTLPGNVVSLRLGGSYGQNGVDTLAGGNTMSGAVEGGTVKTLGAMAGVMAMPDVDRDLIPYVLAGAGFMNSRFRGSTTSFTWATGVGATLQTDFAELYGEIRFVRARKEGRNEDMVPLTAGVRIVNR